MDTLPACRFLLMELAATQSETINLPNLIKIWETIRIFKKVKTLMWRQTSNCF